MFKQVVRAHKTFVVESLEEVAAHLAEHLIAVSPVSAHDEICDVIGQPLVDRVEVVGMIGRSR